MDSINNGFQGASLLRQLILDAHRDLWIDHALHNTLGLQFAQAIAQDTIGEAVHQAMVETISLGRP